MRLRGAKQVHYESGPNMTPLVDVVMVILIFLMLAGSFGGVERYLSSNVPIMAEGAGVKPEGYVPDTPLEVRVDRGSRPDHFDVRAGKIAMTIDASSHEVWMSQMDSLTAALARMRQDLNDAGTASDKIQVEIHPQKGIAYEHTIRVFEALTQAEFQKVSFAPSHP